jgi:hypothetical protein
MSYKLKHRRTFQRLTRGRSYFCMFQWMVKKKTKFLGGVKGVILKSNLCSENEKDFLWTKKGPNDRKYRKAIV